MENRTLSTEPVSDPSPVREAFNRTRQRMENEIIGQELLVNRLLITLLADGHLLVEGAPGLAKTRAVKSLADCIEGDFQRLQFTPDLLPADLTGTEIYKRDLDSFTFQPGPLFHNIILADEINRAPAKVQSALLEAMSERQISVGRKTHKLPELFMVMATQNPIEQEGTYPLPEAQLDRFLMQVNVDYPDSMSEKKILELARGEARAELGESPDKEAILAPETIRKARTEVLDLFLAEPLQEYIVQLVVATRTPGAYSEELARWIEYGASPRATIALDRCARARAWLDQRDFVSPEDIQAVIHDILRHRLLLSFEAEAEGITSDRVVDELVRRIPVP